MQTGILITIVRKNTLEQMLMLACGYDKYLINACLQKSFYRIKYHWLIIDRQ